jgi:hypothetical protein
MMDIPDDLNDPGRHRGNDPPPDTGRTVRSPGGPDPGSGSATPTPARYQLLRHTDADRFRLRAHPPRAVVDGVDDGYEEVGQYGTPGAVQDALADLPERPYHIVFEVGDGDEVFLERDSARDHPWLGNPEYAVATFFTDPDAAAEYAGE